MSPIGANLQSVRRRISEALQGDSRAITIVAVSKSQPAERLREAAEAGCADFGESYLQEALPKVAALGREGRAWHFIGALQSNKARDIALNFDWVHGVDRAKIAQSLSRHRDGIAAPLDVCIQVNISDEATKNGVEAIDAPALAREIAALPNIRLRGLMGMASPTRDPGRQRAEFSALRETFERLRGEGHDIDTLSMGMSDDFEVAIAEGATMVRIGSAIFGERPE